MVDAYSPMLDAEPPLGEMGDAQHISVHVDDDGDVTVDIGGHDEPPPPDPGPSKFNDNLADVLDEYELDKIAGDLLDGIEEDDAGRQEWLQQCAKFIDLLGIGPLKTEALGDGPEGTAKIVHPLLLEAVLRFQANARGEILPTDGPVKIRDDDNLSIPDELIDAYEKDMNHYLTVVATEYVPSTDAMLFTLGLKGTSFKKVYHHPVKRRPVSDVVDMDDLIVSVGSEDFQSAIRITHQLTLTKAQMKRMQLVGAYRQVDIDTPGDDEDAGRHVDTIEGRQTSQREEDRSYKVYECYCELDLLGFERLDEDHLISGLPLPYKVSIDVGSRKILEIRRNWREDDPEQQRRQVFVDYQFVKWGGFYGLGLGHILLNTANAATAAWRMMLDAGQLANFPSGFIDKDATRQNSSDFRAGVGKFLPIQTNGTKRVADMVTPFPFKGIDQGLMALTENIIETASRVGGTAETNVGEGRADAPVGTTLALIEQAQKIMDAVHKRIHSSQQREFELLVDLFREDPESFWKFNRRPALPWDIEATLYALNNCDLVPVADPNTSSRMQRLGKMQVLLQVAGDAPQLFNLPEVMERVVRELNIPDYKALLNENPPNGGLPPPKGAQGAAPDPMAPIKAQAMMMDAQTRRTAAMAKIQSDMDRNKIQAAMTMAKIKNPQADPNAALAAHISMQDAETRRIDAITRQQALHVKHADTVIDNTNQALDRQSENNIAALNAHKELALHAATLGDNHMARQADIEAAKLAAEGRSNA